MTYIYRGDALDPRSPEEKARDYHYSEIGFGATGVTWENKSYYKRYKERKQDGSGACGGHASAKAFETFSNQKSAHPIYYQRFNFPTPGMFLQDIGRILKNIGTVTEDKDPSELLSEDKMNLPLKVTPTDKIGGYVFVDPKNIDDLAKVIRDYKNCILLIRGNWNEYMQYVPTFLGEIDFGHFVTGVDFTLYNGQKAIVIEDSVGDQSSERGQRILTEDFLTKCCVQAMFLIPKVEEVTKPKLVFTTTLSWGDKGSEVEKLQTMLIYEKFLLLDKPTGNFGNMTSHALQKWQIFHGFNDFKGETDMTKIHFGRKSLTLSNALYA